MTRPQLRACAGVVALVVIVALIAHARASVPAPVPPMAETQSSAFSVWHPGEAVGGVQHHVGTSHSWLARDVRGAIVLPHRYPKYVGANGTSVITHGWRVRPIMDPNWYLSPPSTAAW